MKKIIVTYLLGLISHWAIAQSRNNEFISILKVLVSDDKFRERSFTNASKINREYLYIHYNTVLRIYDSNLDPNSVFSGPGPFMRKIFSDSNRFVFVVNNIRLSDTIIYYTVFDKIDISDNKASIEIHTSSVSPWKEFSRYYKAKLYMRRKKGQWTLISQQINTIKCCDGIYGNRTKEVLKPN